MNKMELVEQIAKRADLTVVAACKAFDKLWEVIGETLSAGDTIPVAGIGTFSVGARAGRKGRHPMTGEEIIIPPSKTIKFKAGKRLKDAVNQNVEE